ncbi:MULTISPECIES: hypothetical protein [unclassified Modestobacter]|uniref:hypothetical protein n=1 Tax=unclassified Modestobacter TaxID=2643866 RepID=UPI0022AA5AAD|nr:MULTISPECIES: hypothetical protein [unclassified Modestobacter]MCZ2826217.1 hypothetical protein [Modestobacter sp. VKM Ac-2981]MCZ2852718.1 hypothetical protein [Modestobacter sp. VKM Ac-2982]
MTAHLVVCGAGAGLAMIGHFPHRPPLWVPHALGLVAMVVAWLPAARPLGEPLALLALAALLAWQLRRVRTPAARWSGAVDTAAMAALIALAGVGGGTAAGGVHGAHHTGAEGTLPYAVAVLVVWLAVRHVTRQGGPRDHRAGRDDAVPERPDRAGRALGALRFTGGLVMLSGMTAMLT